MPITLEDYLAKLPEELKRQNIAFHLGMRIKVWPEDESFAPLYVRNI